MNERLTIDQIIQAASTLQPFERLRWIEALSHPEPGRQRRVTQLRGLGKRDLERMRCPAVRKRGA